MPHRSSDQASPYGYNAHILGGRTHPPPPPAHMIHPSEAARMAAYQRAQAYGAHPAYSGHRMPPPPMWHPADAASHLTHAEMGHPDSNRPHTQRTNLYESPSARRIRTDTMESAEETAASALLMASGMGTSLKTEVTREMEQHQSADADTQEPLKKRKKHLDVLRRNQPDSKLNIDPATGSPCHISPGSASSREGDGHTDETVTIVTSSSRTLLETSSGSYDKWEAKKDDVLLHFPSVLHKVLDQPDVRSVLQWLPSGEAWRIVRWDALRREVIPRYFPQLCKGEAGSIDAFLGQVRGWGFEEITDGPDAGAYHHLSFVRGTQKLCKHMTFQGIALSATEAKSSVGGQNEGSTAPEASQSILQVPSLTSRSDGEQEPKQPLPEKQHLNITTPSGVQHVQERISPVHPGWQHGGMAMSYRTRDGGYADPRLVHQTSPLRHGVTFPPPYSPRFPFRTPGGPPSPLKSGRGGSRLASRSSFPVSQRGKGSRPRIVRSPIATPNSEKSDAQNKTDESRLSGLGPHLQKKSAIAFISRKMTRKLPLARKSPETTAQVTPTAADGISPNLFAESKSLEVSEVSQVAKV